jgi:hypothetical protein
MPSEHEMKIDKLLKGYARHRREASGAKFELHAATRQMLQGEIARTYRTQSGRTAAPGGVSFWRRFGLSAGVIACFVLVLASIYPVLFPKTATKGISLARQSKPALPELRKRNESPENLTRFSVAREAAPPAGAPLKGPAYARDETKEGGELSKIEAPESLDALAMSVASKATEGIKRVPQAAEAPTLLSDRSNRRLTSSPSQPPRALGLEGGMVRPQAQKETAMAAAVSAVSPDTNAIVSLQVAEGKGLAVTPAKPMDSPRGSLAYGAKSDLNKSKIDEKVQVNAENSAGLYANFSRVAGDTKNAEALDERPIASGGRDSRYDYTFRFNNQTPGNQASQTKVRANRLAEKQERHSSDVSSAVMNSFQLRQLGDTVTIIDADGSIYKGRIVTQELASAASQSNLSVAGRAMQAASNQRERQAQSGTSNAPQNEGGSQSAISQQAQNGLSFQATGSNGSLRQKVAIQGQIVGLNNTLSANSLRVNNQAVPPSGASTGPIFGLSNNATEPIRIRGQVIIGGTNRQEIDAVQQTP